VRGVRTVEEEARLSLTRIRPRLEATFHDYVGTDAWDAFAARLDRVFLDLFRPLLRLYGDHYDFFWHLETVLTTVARAWIERPAYLNRLDAARAAGETTDPWFQSQRMLGGMCYVDLFAGDLSGVRDKIPYFKGLGLTYLHLMPLFLAPAGNSDGGYAVSSYRHVDPALGTMDELALLARELHDNGIALVLDFVLNHTSDEHPWARRALAGERDYQDYYYMFPDRALPDAYERTLRPIFPDQRPGSFTYRPEVDRWVWTTFNSFQWDLNYTNPAVFDRMVGELLFLANQGAQALRFDALAFIWKRLGTSCENLPEAHLVIQAFNAAARLAAPALLFKSEAIVHPDEVARYISPRECRLSYNPLLMALLWEALATREVRLLELSLRERFAIDPRCAWVDYVRSHDDIGWTFDDGDAARLGIDGFDHRRFLNAFYTGRFPGSFARGLPFQENPHSGDARVAGTCASLAGLEAALHDNPDATMKTVETDDNSDAVVKTVKTDDSSDAAMKTVETDHGVQRILLLYDVILSIGGIPLLYLGDEVGTLNDYSYRDDEAKAGDSRWVHRPIADWDRAARHADPESVSGRVYDGLARLIGLRKGRQAFAGGATDIIGTGNGHVFGYVRHHDDDRVLVLANFSERAQPIAGQRPAPARAGLHLHGPHHERGHLSGARRRRPLPCPLSPAMAYGRRIG